jgi:tetratricopeptide (TPR) repeat protein
MNTDLFPPLHSSHGSTATKSARLHVLIPPGANSRELCTTLAALGTAKDPRLFITASAPRDWAETPQDVRLSLLDSSSVLLDDKSMGDPIANLGLTEDSVLCLLQAGAIPPRGWLETLLSHGRLEPGARAVAATGDTSELNAWADAAERARRSWYRLAEDRSRVETPLLALFRPTDCKRELRDWWRSGAHGSLRLPPGGRLLLAKDLLVRSPYSSPDQSPSIQSHMRDPRIEPDRRTDCVEDAEDQRERLLEVLEDGPHPEASLYLTRLALGRGRRAEAADHARACLESWPKSSEAKLLLARSLIGQNRIDSALTILEDLQQSGPMTTDLHGGLFACLGSIWLRKSDPLQARPCIDEALVLEPENVVALYGRARLNLALGEFEAALADLLVITRLAPLNPDPWFELGRAHVLAGEYAMGRASLLHLLKLTPEHDAARALLERTDPDLCPHPQSDLPDSDGQLWSNLK